MPVEYRKGDLFEYKGSMAHGVNNVGKMGKGIAVKFKEKWPGMFKNYAELCDTGKFFPGMTYAFRVIDFNDEKLSFDEYYIYNLCIKSHWKLPSETYMIWAALRNMVQHMEQNGVTEVAMPAIGAGLGGLDWETQVKPIVEEVGSQTPCLLVVYLQEYTTLQIKDTDDGFNKHLHDVDNAK